MIRVSDLHDLLTCNSMDGKLVWKPRSVDGFSSRRSAASWNSRYAGKEAGYVRNGYLIISIFDRDYQAHRVMWAMCHGQWPSGDLDHINHNRCDNRLVNLRPVSRGENNRNHSISKRNTSGCVGVYQRGDKWKASIGTGKRHLGTFDTFEGAVEARKRAEREFGFHPNHGKAMRAFFGALAGPGAER